MRKITLSKYINKNAFLILPISLLFVSSPLLSLDQNSLLASDEVGFEFTDEQSRQTTSGAGESHNGWETYSREMCFRVDQVKIEKAQIKLTDAWTDWPQVTIERADEYFAFSPETDLQLDTEKTLLRWKSLLEGSSEVCLYGTFLQYLDDAIGDASGSLFVLHSLKTEKGYWDTHDQLSQNAVEDEVDSVELESVSEHVDE